MRRKNLFLIAITQDEMVSWSLGTSWDDSPGLVMLAELPL